MCIQCVWTRGNCITVPSHRLQLCHSPEFELECWWKQVTRVNVGLFSYFSQMLQPSLWGAASLIIEEHCGVPHGLDPVCEPQLLFKETGSLLFLNVNLFGNETFPFTTGISFFLLLCILCQLKSGRQKQKRWKWLLCFALTVVTLIDLWTARVNIFCDYHYFMCLVM